MDDNTVMECKKDNTIPADKAILHLNLINRRIIVTFITVCISVCVAFIIMTLIFTNANTQREKNILELFTGKDGNPAAMEVSDGMQQQTDY